MPGREGPWKRFAAEVGGQYVGGAVRAQVGDWVVTLDSRVRKYGYGGEATRQWTRMRARCKTRGAFRFTVKPRLQQGEVVQDFDRSFIVRGNKRSVVNAVFSEPKIRELIQRSLLPVDKSGDSAVTALLRGTVFHDTHPPAELRLGPEKDISDWLVDVLLRMYRPRRFPREKLHFVEEGVITDVERLKSLLNLFSEILGALQGMGLVSPAATR
jgi:hypothetical protein